MILLVLKNGKFAYMNCKLIYISFMRLTDKVSRDWYVDYCIEKGAVVEYWDIVSLVREEHEEKGALDVGYLRYVKTYREFELMLQQPENQAAAFVMLISYSGRFSKPFRLLSKYNCKMVFFNWGAMPATAPEPKLQRIIVRLFKNPIDFFKTVIDVILGILLRKLNIVKRFDIAFVAGKELAAIDQYAKKVVPFNLCDFDHFKSVKLSGKRVVQGKYAVYVDQNLPYHSDFSLSSIPTLNPNNYYQSLCRFFGLIQDAYDIKIIIAAHPRANYGCEKFEGRETYRLQTAELVKDSEFMILHYTNALSYAVLNLKPALFIYTDEMMYVYKNTLVRQIESLALYLKASIYNIDQIADAHQVNIQPLNYERYDMYKYSYLTSHESENLTSAEIFWLEINAL